MQVHISSSEVEIRQEGKETRGETAWCCSACPDAMPEGKNLYPVRRGYAKDRVRRTAVAPLIIRLDDRMPIWVCCRSAKVLSTIAKGSLGSASSDDVVLLVISQALVQEQQFRGVQQTSLIPQGSLHGVCLLLKWPSNKGQKTPLE